MTTSQEAATQNTTARHELDSKIYDPTTAHLLAFAGVGIPDERLIGEQQFHKPTSESTRHNLEQAQERENFAAVLRGLLPKATHEEVIDYTNKYFGWFISYDDKKADYAPGFVTLEGLQQSENEMADAVMHLPVSEVIWKYSRLRDDYALIQRGAVAKQNSTSPLRHASEDILSQYSRVLQEFEEVENMADTTVDALRTLCSQLYGLQASVYGEQIESTFSPTEIHYFEAAHAVLSGESNVMQPGHENIGSEREADIAARLADIEQHIDPDGVLPHIALIDDGKYASTVMKGAVRYGAYSDDEPLGEIQLRESETELGVVEVAWARVDEPGEGYGKALYLAAIKQVLGLGKNLANDPVVTSSEAAGLWLWLVERGVATEIQPFAFGDDGLLHGSYVVRSAVQ